jgi:hypothetical protein
MAIISVFRSEVYRKVDDGAEDGGDHAAARERKAKGRYQWSGPILQKLAYRLGNGQIRRGRLMLAGLLGHAEEYKARRASCQPEDVFPIELCF